MTNEQVQEIQAALDEMDRLAAVHIQLQNDPSAIIKDVFEAERLRDRHEAYVEREARSVWLRALLQERAALVDAMRTLQNAGIDEIIRHYMGRAETASIYGEYRESLTVDQLIAVVNGLQCVKEALARLE